MFVSLLMIKYNFYKIGFIVSVNSSIYFSPFYKKKPKNKKLRLGKKVQNK